MSGQHNILNAELNRKSPKGSSLKSALKSTFSQDKIASVSGTEKQPINKKK